jgi:transmembrane sensor
MEEQQDHISENNLSALLTAADLSAREKLGELSADEAALLASWLQDDSAHARWQADQENATRFAHLLSVYRSLEQAKDNEWEKFSASHLPPSFVTPQSRQPVRRVHRVHFLKTAWVRYAAAILIILGIGAYLWNTEQKKTPASTAEASAKAVKNDVAPGSTKATLTLSNGQTVDLTLETGVIKESGANIQNENGRLEYGKADKVVFNTMSTPRGGQYQLTLPDGTNVWLNAASSITYPTAFTTSTREVTITGEAYFEVRKNTAKPFVVKTQKEDITVLGTEFNVNAYANEPAMKTSLLEGSVKVGNSVLRPGQAYVNGTIIITNVQQDVAWKNGVFNFEGADLRTVMRQLERWYDIEVKITGTPKPGRFRGKLYRNLTLNQITNILNEMDITFRTEGRTLFVE